MAAQERSADAGHQLWQKRCARSKRRYLLNLRGFHLSRWRPLQQQMLSSPLVDASLVFTISKSSSFAASLVSNLIDSNASLMAASADLRSFSAFAFLSGGVLLQKVVVVPLLSASESPTRERPADAYRSSVRPNAMPVTSFFAERTEQRISLFRRF